MAQKARTGSLQGLFSGPGAPRVITVSGANKDIGKSSLVAYLVEHCRDCAAIKVTLHDERPPGEAVIEESRSAREGGRDTERMREAGASPVFWVRSTARDLPADLEKVAPLLRAPVVIVEGNSVLEHLRPDYAVFIMGPGMGDFKPSAFGALAKADTVLVDGGKNITGRRLLELERKVKAVNPGAKLLVVAELGREAAWSILLSRVAGRIGGGHMAEEIDERVLEAVKAKAEDGRISCPVALKLAEDLRVPPALVGRAANALELKIAKCSLGCF